MYSTEIQNTLNLLYTDTRSRNLFRNNRKSFYTLYDIHFPELVAFFDRLDPGQLDFFANGLFAKRFHAVADLLPASARVLGQSFQKFFREFSESFLPSGIHKHHEDAIAFCEFVLEKAESEMIQCMLHFEKDQVENFIRPHPSMLCIYPLDPLQVRKDILNGKGTGKPVQKRTLLLWWRGKLRRVFHF